MRHKAPSGTITYRFARSITDSVAKLALAILFAEAVTGPFSASPLFRLGIVVGIGIAVGLAAEGFLLWLERRRPTVQPLT